MVQTLASTLTFERPIWLWLALVALPLAAVGLRWFTSMSWARRASAVVARTVLAVLIVAMLAGASSVRTTDVMAVVAVVDVSGSVRRFADAGRTAEGARVDPSVAARRFLEDASRRRGPDDLLGLVLFDGRTVVVATPSRGDVLSRSMEVEPVEGSDLDSALRRAAGLIPAGAAGRLVVFSDGIETRGDAARAADQVAGAARGRGRAGAGLPIDAVPLPVLVERETVVEFVDAPPTAPEGGTVSLRVGFFSTAGATGRLRLVRDGQPIDLAPGSGDPSRPVTVPPGRSVQVIPVELGPGRLHRFEAVFEPDAAIVAAGPRRLSGDTDLDNNRAESFTVTPGRGSILVLDGVSRGGPGPGATLPDTLRRAGFDVRAIVPENLPASLLELQAYDLVILQNVPAESLGPAQQTALVAHVRDMGGGLVMVGGPDSFGAGGWKGTPVEDILPVRLDLPEKLVVPETAIMLVLDSSGSMGRSLMGSARTKQTIANESAAQAVRTLDKSDLVGVIEFNSAYSTVVELGPNTDPEATARRILAIGSGGGTNIGPALEHAGELLRGVDSKVKHVIVLTDGHSADAETLPETAGLLSLDGINVSTIGVGSDVDSSNLRAMAAAGGGTFYEVLSPDVLPRVFLRAVRVVRSPMLRETPFDVAVPATGSAMVDGLGPPPRLGGMVLTRPRSDPTITNSLVSSSGDPVLADWPVGLGRVAAFTSDAHRWARPWLGWDGYARLWSQLARVCSRPPGSTRDELEADATSGGVSVRVTLADDGGRPRDGAVVPATIYPSAGPPVTVSLAQTGPGVYEGWAPIDQAGTHVVVAKPSLGGVPLMPVIGGATAAAGVEFRRLEAAPELLRRIADRSGGRVLRLADGPDIDLFDRAGAAPARAASPMWRTLLVWAIAVMLFDAGTRRVAWDRLIPPRAALAGARRTGAGAARSLAGLARRAATQAPAPLAEADAAAVEQAAARRRYEEAVAAARAERTAARATPPRDATPPGPPRAQPASPEQGLMAAKRRARDRFRE